jgi:hypothetical protein
MISPPTRTSSRSTSSSDDAEFEDAVDFIQPSPDPNSSEISATGGKGPSIALKVRNDGLAEQPPDLLLVTDNGLEGALADLGLDDVELDLPPPKVAEQLLSSDLKELKACVKMFLNSRFLEAEKILRSKYKKSLYCKFEGTWSKYFKSIHSLSPDVFCDPSRFRPLPVACLDINIIIRLWWLQES